MGFSELYTLSQQFLRHTEVSRRSPSTRAAYDNGEVVKLSPLLLRNRVVNTGASSKTDQIRIITKEKTPASN